MTDRPTTSKNPASKPNDDKKKHTEDLLDEALRETFPASDPPAMLEPGHLQPPPKEKKK
ncbi:MAG: hypothetical protein K9G60_16840 [Pseudolabrys sp.]|nr:hypothetical protein [Pseudolabrys sp.]